MTSELWWDDEDAVHITRRCAGSVLTVIVDPEDNSGVNAWKTRGIDLRDYLEGKEARP